MLPIDRTVSIDVIGCGGTGSQVLTGLARIHTAVLACGHKHGLFVRAYDPAKVTHANVGRQLFHIGDVDGGKAEVLIRRLNFFFQVHWNWHKSKWGGSNADLVLVCVDTGRDRGKIQLRLNHKRQYAIDCGNEREFGQVILGGKEYGDLYEEFPALKTSVDDDDTPSCSLAQSVGRQDLFINQAVATHCCDIVWKMIRFGQLDYRGTYINLKSGVTQPIKS